MGLEEFGDGDKDHRFRFVIRDAVGDQVLFRARNFTQTDPTSFNKVVETNFGQFLRSRDTRGHSFGGKFYSLETGDTVVLENRALMLRPFIYVGEVIVKDPILTPADFDINLEPWVLLLRASVETGNPITIG